MSTQHQRFALKSLALQVGVVLLFIAPIAGYAAFTVNKPTTGGVNTTGGNNGLVGWWTFDGGDLTQNVADKSGQGNHARLIGFTSTSSAQVVGKIGQALDFDGSNDRAKIGPNGTSILQNVSGATLAAWVKVDTFTARSGVVWVSRNGNSSLGRAALQLDNTNVRALGRSADGDAAQTVTTTDTLQAGQWYLLVATFDYPNDTISVYINGVLSLSGPVSFSANTTSNTTSDTADIGVGDQNNSEWVNGQIDDVRIYNRVLSAEEVSRLYGLGSTSYINKPTTGGVNTAGGNNGLIGWWTFDGGDLTQNAADKSGQGYHARLNGFTSTTTVIGKLGQAISFDGVNDYAITSPSTAAYSFANSTTLSFWFIQRSEPSAFPGLLRYASFGTDGWIYYCNSSLDSCAFKIGNGTISRDGYGGDTSVTKGVWYHITYVYDEENSTFKRYVNGALVTTVDTTVTSMPDMSAYNSTLRMGVGDSSGFHDGTLDDLRIYNRALSADEVKRLYGLGSTSYINKPTTGGVNAPSTSNGLIGWWTFDGGDLTQNAADKSGQGNAGRLVGFTSTTTVIGKLGQALTFDGSDDRASIANTSPYEGLSAITVSAWVKPAQNSADAYIIAKGVGGTADWLFFQDDVGTVSGRTDIYSFFVGNSTQSSRAEASSNAVQVGTWTHVVGTWQQSPEQVRIYINGVLDQSDTQLQGATMGTGDALNIGSNSTPTSFYNGSLDDIRVYNRVLSADEVKRLYELGL